VQQEVESRQIGLHKLIRGEEEQLVLDQRSSDRASGDQVLAVEFSAASEIVDEVVGLGEVVAEVAVGAAVNLVCPALCDDVDRAPEGDPELGGKGVRFDLNLLVRVPGYRCSGFLPQPVFVLAAVDSRVFVGTVAPADRKPGGGKAGEAGLLRPGR